MASPTVVGRCIVVAGVPRTGPPSDRAFAHRARVRTIAGWFPAPVNASASRNFGSDNSGSLATLENVCNTPWRLSPPISLSARTSACQSEFCLSQLACSFWLAAWTCFAARSTRVCATGMGKPCSLARFVKSPKRSSSFDSPSGRVILSASNGSGAAGASLPRTDGAGASASGVVGVVRVSVAIAEASGADCAWSLNFHLLQHLEVHIVVGLHRLGL